MIGNCSADLVGKSFVYLGQQQCLLGGNMWLIKHTQNPKYLLHALNSPHVKRVIQVLSVKQNMQGNLGRISSSDVKSISIPLPPLEIQEQIANYLDDLMINEIELSDSLKEMLEIRKKQYEYYKEQILTSEIDKWDIRTIEEIAIEIYTGKEVRKDQLGTGDFPSVKCGDVNKKLGRFFKKCLCFVDVNLIHNPKYFEYGDVLISQVGHSKQEAGIATAYLGNRKGVLGGAVHVIKHNQNPQFLSYILSSIYCRKQIEVKSVGGTFVNFTIKELKKIKVPIPPLETQEKIASILEKLDSQITKLERDIQELTSARQSQCQFLTTQIIN